MYLILICVLIPSAIHFDIASLSAHAFPRESSEYQEGTNRSVARKKRSCCVMPSNPENGVYTIGNTSVGTFKPGCYVKPFSVLRVLCDRNHTSSPPDNPTPLCFNGKWTSEPPKCAVSCPGINSTITTKFSCSFMGRPLDSCMHAVEDTIATITCEPFYEEYTLWRSNTRVCRNGSWDQPIPNCYAECGRQFSGTGGECYSVLTGAILAKRYEYPWYVGIYNAANNELSCGGSILSERVIISAAHCFTDLSTGDKFPKENYLIAVGKYYRTYGDPRDNTSEQHSTIDDIHIPGRYRGAETNYEADLAVVVLKTRLQLSESVKPVCMDWQITPSDDQQFSGTDVGMIAGWGQTVEGGQPSQKLRKLNIPVSPFVQCIEEVPKSFRRFLTHDKVCAGFLNKGAAPCAGDSGGGFTFIDADARQYLRGIISISPATLEMNCDSNQYATYTLLANKLPTKAELSFTSEN